MPAGMVPCYQQCLYVWCLTVCHACWPIATATDILQVSADERRMGTSVVLPVQRCNYIRHVHRSGATLKYVCLYSTTISDMHAVSIYSDTRVCEVLLHQARSSDMPIR